MSIDQIIAARHGIWGVDYPADKYADFQHEADGIYGERFRQLLQDGADVVLDRAFYSRDHRLEFRAMIENAGARAVLVYFKAGRDVLWRRICERRANGVNADSALEITEELLDAYVEGFQHPSGEGEIVIEVE